VIPRRDDTEILVKLGDKVRAGLTLIARQPLPVSSVSGVITKTDWKVGPPEGGFVSPVQVPI